MSNPLSECEMKALAIWLQQRSGLKPDQLAYVLRAIDSHDALLEVARDLLDALTHTGPCQCCSGSNEDGHEPDCRILSARAAIAMAEKGA